MTAATGHKLHTHRTTALVAIFEERLSEIKPTNRHGFEVSLVSTAEKNTLVCNNEVPPHSLTDAWSPAVLFRRAQETRCRSCSGIQKLLWGTDTLNNRKKHKLATCDFQSHFDQTHKPWNQKGVFHKALCISSISQSHWVRLGSFPSPCGAFPFRSPPVSADLPWGLATAVGHYRLVSRACWGHDMACGTCAGSGGKAEPVRWADW